MTERPERKKWSETRNHELTLEELFQLIGDVEWNLKDHIWELKQEVEELKSQVETLNYKLGTYD
jgi:predicted RNase H-like nuclease (RuvC/YqgF family)